MVDFIIAVNHVTHKVIPRYPELISRKLLNFMILKQRLLRIAKICHLGHSIKCLLLKSLYKIALNLPQEKLSHKKYKINVLRFLSNKLITVSSKEVEIKKLNIYQRDSLLSCQINLNAYKSIRNQLVKQ